ncbi:pyridoxine 5'-phosphate oxidase C-terminal domain-containing protein [Pontibacterium sp.]|uniref:pyridoxine 5'-phosphate oxidase C-terminal domain-containing protein n=1 Tax=Pontibacterium sp. TaxID=2036026 RepID=UPI003565C7AA
MQKPCVIFCCDFAATTQQSARRLGIRAKQVISSRRLLEDKFKALKRSFTDTEVPLPKFWGGSRVHLSQIEFRQGGASQLHDRFQYMRDQNDSWNIERLSP